MCVWHGRRSDLNNNTDPSPAPGPGCHQLKHISAAATSALPQAPVTRHPARPHTTRALLNTPDSHIFLRKRNPVRVLQL